MSNVRAMALLDRLPFRTSRLGPAGGCVRVAVTVAVAVGVVVALPPGTRMNDPARRTEGSAMSFRAASAATVVPNRFASENIVSPAWTSYHRVPAGAVGVGVGVDVGEAVAVAVGVAVTVVGTGDGVRGVAVGDTVAVPVPVGVGVDGIDEPPQLPNTRPTATTAADTGATASQPRLDGFIGPS
jgi:hypothetical protein